MATAAPLSSERLDLRRVWRLTHPHSQMIRLSHVRAVCGETRARAGSASAPGSVRAGLLLLVEKHVRRVCYAGRACDAGCEHRAQALQALLSTCDSATRESRAPLANSSQGLFSENLRRKRHSCSSSELHAKHTWAPRPLPCLPCRGGGCSARGPPARRP